MGEIASIFTAFGQIAEIAVNVGFLFAADAAAEGGARSGARRKDGAAPAFDPNRVPFTTGDIQWSTDQYGYYLYAYNNGHDAVALNFVDAGSTAGSTHSSGPTTIRAGDLVDVTDILKPLGKNPSVTMTTIGDTGIQMARSGLSGDTAQDRFGGETLKAMALGIPGLAVDAAATLLSGVNFSVTGTAEAPQITFQVARPITGSFTATINNGPWNATVSGDIDTSYSYSGSFSFDIPPFLGIGGVVDWIEMVMLVPESQLLADSDARVRVIRSREASAAHPA